LSSLRGAAVWAFRIDGVVHEHQTIPGVVEDVHQIIQRLKQLTLVLAPEVDEAVLRFKVEKARPVYARDLEQHGSVTIVNPDQLLFTVQDDRDISGELYVNKGRGYVEAEQHQVDRTLAVDVVRVDSIYNPVRRANFTVGEKALGEIAELLRREGLNFGMQLEEMPGGDIRVIDPGTAPQAQLTGAEEE